MAQLAWGGWCTKDAEQRRWGRGWLGLPGEGSSAPPRGGQWGLRKDGAQMGALGLSSLEVSHGLQTQSDHGQERGQEMPIIYFFGF